MPGSLTRNTANTPKFVKMTIQSYLPLVIIEGSVGFYTTHLKWLMKDTGKTVTIASQVCNALLQAETLDTPQDTKHTL